MGSVGLLTYCADLESTMAQGAGCYSAAAVARQTEIEVLLGGGRNPAGRMVGIGKINKVLPEPTTATIEKTQ